MSGYRNLRKRNVVVKKIMRCAQWKSIFSRSIPFFHPPNSSAFFSGLKIWKSQGGMDLDYGMDALKFSIAFVERFLSPY